MIDDEPVWVDARAVGVGFTAADEAGKVDCHLMLELPVPVGRINVRLDGGAVASLYDSLRRAVTMSPDQVAEFVGRVRGNEDNG